MKVLDTHSPQNCFAISNKGEPGIHTWLIHRFPIECSEETSSRLRFKDSECVWLTIRPNDDFSSRFWDDWDDNEDVDEKKQEPIEEECVEECENAKKKNAKKNAKKTTEPQNCWTISENL